MFGDYRYKPGDKVLFKNRLTGENVKCVIDEFMINNLDDSVTYKLREVNGARVYTTSDPSLLQLISPYVRYDKISTSLRYGLHRSEAFMPHPKKVIFNGEVTIVLWGDGTKTVVRCDCTKYEYSKEKAVMYATFKKIFGNTTRTLRYIQEFEKASGEDVLPKETETSEAEAQDETPKCIETLRGEEEQSED